MVPGGAVGRLLDAYPNLGCDLSAGSGRNALARDLDHARQFVAKYQDRLLFGRDTYDGQLHETLGSLDLAPEVTEAIYHANAERLLGIQP